MLNFVCACGQSYDNLGFFLDHALPCHRRRAADQARRSAVPPLINYAEEQRRKARERAAAKRDYARRETQPPPTQLRPARYRERREVAG